MRILIETGLGKGVAEYGNMGDVAMLQVAINRLLRIWPQASLQVLTDSPEHLARFCPGATPLANLGRDIWFAEGIMLGRYTHSVPAGARRVLMALKKEARLRWPGLLKSMMSTRLKRKKRGAGASALTSFTQALSSADLMLISGAGGFFGGCRKWNMDTLDLVETAVRRQIPVAMLGQGFGPLTDPEVLDRAKNILPAVNLLTLRGNRGAAALLESLGVSPSLVHTTGDEAIELAYGARSSEEGFGLGINLRISKSAQTDEGDIDKIQPVLHEFARRQHVAIIPLPIAQHSYDRDDQAVRKLLAGLDDVSDGGASLNSPLKVIQQAGRCRIVLTGAYHAAVFALAQGIPVVGLARSPYFASKFLGLGDQFGQGCETLLLDDPKLTAKLTGALGRAWGSAAQLREPLREAARKQMVASWAAYEKMGRLLHSRKGKEEGSAVFGVGMSEPLRPGHGRHGAPASSGKQHEPE